MIFSYSKEGSIRKDNIMTMAIIQLVSMFVLISAVSSFDIHSSSPQKNIQKRRDVFAIVASTILSSKPVFAEEKSYSSNARNMARFNAGDSSGGSTYDNNPTSPKARSRYVICL